MADEWTTIRIRRTTQKELEKRGKAKNWDDVIRRELGIKPDDKLDVK